MKNKINIMELEQRLEMGLWSFAKTAKGESGKDGQDGKPGENGKSGQDGKSGENGKSVTVINGKEVNQTTVKKDSID